MQLDEIVNYLNKHEDKSIKYRREFNDGIYKINHSLLSLRDELIQTLSIQLRENSSGLELCKDIETLNGYISNLKSLIGCSIEEESAKIQQKLKDVKLYLCNDNICPSCGCNMEDTMTRYSVTLVGNIVSRSLRTYRCPCCNRFFVTSDELNQIDIDNTNLIINKDLFQNNPVIDYYTVIVLTNTLKCSQEGHNIKDVCIHIPIINDSGQLDVVAVNAGYCKECNRFVMLKSDFKLINGVIICEVIDETTINQKLESDEIEIKQYESLLYRRGYNVKTKDNKSDEQRQMILAMVIESNLMTRHEIMSHLGTLIERGRKIDKWKQAVQKWTSDRKFVSEYERGDLPKVIADRIILKYSEKK